MASPSTALMFDPDAEFVTQTQHDEYVQWCAGELLEVADEKPGSGPMIFATALHAACCLWVVAQAQIHLDEDVVERREGHQKNLAALFTRARCVERAKGDINFGELVAARIALDCFKPVGKYAGTLLDAAKIAIEALELIFIYPPIDKWSMPCPGPWALILCGSVLLEEISEDPQPLTYGDYSVKPSPGMVGKIAWDAANRTAQSVGAAPPSPN